MSDELVIPGSGQLELESGTQLGEALVVDRPMMELLTTMLVELRVIAQLLYEAQGNMSDPQTLRTQLESEL